MGLTIPLNLIPPPVGPRFRRLRPKKALFHGPCPRGHTVFMATDWLIAVNQKFLNYFENVKKCNPKKIKT